MTIIKHSIVLIFMLLVLWKPICHSTSTPFHKIYTQSHFDDSTHQFEDLNDESFSLFLLILGGAFMCIFIGIGAFLTATILLGIFALISFGVLSISVMIGIAKKSIQKGFEILVLMSASLVGLGMGALFWGVGNLYLHWMTTYKAIGLGAITGLIGGFLLGVFAIFIIQRLSALLKQKLEQ